MVSLRPLMLLSVLLLFGWIPSSQAKSGKDPVEFAIRGFHLDLRIQVMTPQALKSFAKELSDFGINTLVMEWEGTYPFKRHGIISNRFSYTRAEVAEFIGYCDGLGIQVIPLQQSLGHVEYILRHPRYHHLKEDRKDISQLCPMGPEANRALFTELFADVAETHNSPYIHIGGDETYLLGHCAKCAKKVAEEGKSKLFVDHMKMIAQLVLDQGKIPVMWADIILKHPEAAEELPKEIIFIDWNYGWKTNHFGDIVALQEKGFRFWGAPAIRCHPDNWYVTDWTTHFNNQRDFIPYARQAGYEGMIMTSWSTTGVYGFIWDVGYDVMDMIQIRNTYPLPGFRVLIASYASALAGSEPLDAKAFVSDYAKTRFGFNERDTEAFWQFLMAAPTLVDFGHKDLVAHIAGLEAAYAPIRDRLFVCVPTRNEQEFAHFEMMADLRMHYLSYKGIEAQANATGFTTAQAPVLLAKLDAVLADAKSLDERFGMLMTEFLYPAEIAEQNRWRVEQVQTLHDRLAKLK